MYLVGGDFPQQYHYGVNMEGWQLLPANPRAPCEHLGNDISQNGVPWGQTKVQKTGHVTRRGAFWMTFWVHEPAYRGHSFCQKLKAGHLTGLIGVRIVHVGLKELSEGLQVSGRSIFDKCKDCRKEYDV